MPSSRSRSPISPIPQLRADGIENSGTRSRRGVFDPDVIEGGVGNRDDDLIMTRARLDYEFVAANVRARANAIGKLIRRHDQAHDDERLVRKIEEVAGMHQDPLTLEQLEGRAASSVR